MQQHRGLGKKCCGAAGDGPDATIRLKAAQVKSYWQVFVLAGCAEPSTPLAQGRIEPLMRVA